MVHEQLRALIADVDRLLAAGGAVAAADERLHGRAHFFREHGARIPALLPLADAVERVFNPVPAEAAAAFFRLLLIANQLRAALRVVGAPGPLEPVAPLGPWTTAVPGAVLYRTVATLKRARQQKRPIPEEFLTQGHALDLRLVGPWLAALLHGPRQRHKFIIQHVLPRLGLAVLPDLRRHLAAWDPRTDYQCLHAICVVSPEAGLDACRAALQQGSLSTRVQALQRYLALAPAEAERAAQGLLGSAQPPELRAQAVRVLFRRLAPAALLPLLNRHLTGEEAWQVCALARKPLQRLGQPGIALAIKALLPALKRSDPFERRRVIRTLAQLGSAAEPAVPELLALFPKAHPWWDRKDLVEALARIGRPVEAIVPALLAASSKWFHASPTRTPAAPSSLAFLVGALVELGRKDAATVPLLAEGLGNSSRLVRREVTAALARLGPAAAEALPALCALLRDAWDQVRATAARALGRIGPRAVRAAPVLTEALVDGAKAVRIEAARSLVHLGAATEAVVPVLLEVALNAKEPDALRCEAVYMLGRIAPLGQDAIPALRELRDRGKEGVLLWQATRRALQRLEGDGPAASRGLCAASP